MTVLKYIIVTIMCLFTVLDLQAQGISVASFKMLPNDLTANTNGTEVLDQNGDKAALIKVVTTQTGFTFEGGALGVTKVKQESGEVWVYVPQKSKKITIKHPQLGVLRDYFFPCAIEAARTYEMQLASGIVQTVVKKDAGGNFLTLKVLPENASVYIDGKLQTNDAKGEYSIFLGYGEHQYRVEAGSYSTKSGIVTIGNETSDLNIKLESTLASLSIICPTPDAQIYLNKKLKGNGKWDGTVPAGNYLIEAKKDGYRSSIENIEVVEKENKTVTLQALQPIYGVLKVNVRPIGSVIEIDGCIVGKTPTILDNVIVGRHSIKIKAPNGVELVKQIVIKEGEICEVEDVIPEYTLKQLDSIANSTGDYTMAFKVAVESAEKGDAFAQYLLGRYYDRGTGVSINNSKAIEWFMKSAEQGYADAQCYLGQCYEVGIGVSRDYSKAVEWYRKAAEQGDAFAQSILGWCYYHGHGVSQDYSKAFEWYRKAAEQGDAAAQCYLGVCYKNARGVSQDYSKAFEWYRKAAEQGNAAAQFNLGVCYYEGKGVSQDDSKAVEWYRKSAEQGNAAAQCYLGQCYEVGIGVSQDYSKAVEWYRKSAEQGYANAQCNLGCYYYRGRGVSQDYSKAVEWFQKAAEQGYVEAQYNLGWCYDGGRGVSKNYSKAFEWYRKAAEQGDAFAQYSLGNYYYEGKGVSQDDSKAVEWYRKSAEQGEAAAQYSLGNYYYEGKGVSQDYSKAVEWYRKAAEQGYTKAQCSLGKCYFYGNGVAIDKQKAKEWLEKSAKSGNEVAQKMLKEKF